ncbi:hypothetical protein BV25DRAFT_1828803 [Artomyces pyxidatus]|uniref:Uncharacterized protein n=1 Tax=Artomyces pyxidatus TaxID=48021 RepID=A0ACB8SSR3_9AGAM|nr:hypothetical protein BV25DRAFT_1828803 [Artomyces pyxidatus]
MQSRTSAAPRRTPTGPQFTPTTAPSLRTDRVQHYGYAITDAWLLDYSRRHEHFLQPGEHIDDEFDRMSLTVNVLRIQTGIPRLICEWARPPKVLPPGVEIGPDKEILVLSVLSTTVESWETRPSQAQVDVLQSIMGDKKLRWWRDFYHPSQC